MLVFNIGLVNILLSLILYLQEKGVRVCRAHPPAPTLQPIIKRMGKVETYIQIHFIGTVCSSSFVHSYLATSYIETGKTPWT